MRLLGSLLISLTEEGVVTINFKSNRGQGLAEFALILSLIGLVVIVVALAFGKQLRCTFAELSGYTLQGMQRTFGKSQGDADFIGKYDVNHDGTIDGNDLTYIGSLGLYDCDTGTGDTTGAWWRGI